MTRFALCAALAAGLLTSVAATAKTRLQPPADTRSVFVRLAQEAAGKLLASPAYQARTTGGRKPRLVVGDTLNHSDNDDVRVEDIFNEIREVVVNSGTARLFAKGELEADLIISPDLTSSTAANGRSRTRCYILHLTTSTVAGEYVTESSAQGCE